MMPSSRVMARPGGCSDAWPRDVLRIAIAEAAVAAERRHALLIGRKAAVRAAAHIAAVFGAPRIILRLGAAAESDRGEQVVWRSEDVNRTGTGAAH